MAAVTVCRDFAAQEYKACHCFHICPFHLHEVMEPDARMQRIYFSSWQPPVCDPLSWRLQENQTVLRTGQGVM